jgi:hypothetical protein
MNERPIECPHGVLIGEPCDECIDNFYVHGRHLAFLMTAEIRRLRRKQAQHEADAALGRAVREASAGPTLMRAWSDDEEMPEVVRRVFRIIAEALRGRR